MTLLEQIEAALGRPLTTSESAQLALWESDVRADISTRAVAQGITLEALIPDQVTRFLREALLARLRAAGADGVTQLDVTVDDTRVSRRFESAGSVAYRDEWWSWLGLSGGSGRAFQIDTTPTTVPFSAPSWWLLLGRADL